MGYDVDTNDQELVRYQLLGSAVAGRGIHVAAAREGEKCFTDGRTIYLTPDLDRASELSHLLVQAALIAAGSLDEAPMRRLLGRPSLARRYLSLEGARAVEMVARSLAGIDLGRAGQRGAGMSGSAEESLALSSRWNALPEPPDMFGVIRPRLVLSAFLTQANGDDPRNDQPATPLSWQEDETGDEESEELGPIAKRILKMLSYAPQRSYFLQKHVKSGGKGHPEPSDGVGALKVGSIRSATRRAPHASLTPLPRSAARVGCPPEGGRAFRYPEWDAHTSSYLMNACTVREVEPRCEDAQQIERPDSDVLRRHLVRVGLSLERRRREPQGDDIDIDAAVESQIALRVGYSHDEGLYIESQRRKRNLSVLVLVDVSGSAAEGVVGQERIHDQQRSTALMLTDTFDKLGDRVALYGFRSEGRAAVYFIRLKGFEDPLNTQVYQRVAGIAPTGFTRLGAAIRHAAFVLEHGGGTDRRLLIVLSDGFPYDDEYEGRYAEADARVALAEARSRGIGCLCLTLGASTEPEALARVFGTASHANASSLDSLLPDMGLLFRRALASADRERRLAQRGHSLVRRGA